MDITTITRKKSGKSLTVDIRVQVLEAVGFPKKHKLGQSNYYIIFNVDNGKDQTTTTFRAGEPSVKLDYVFTCTVDKLSLLSARVYCAHKHRPGDDHLIATSHIRVLGEPRNEQISISLRKPEAQSASPEHGTITLRLSLEVPATKKSVETTTSAALKRSSTGKSFMKLARSTTGVSQSTTVLSGAASIISHNASLQNQADGGLAALSSFEAMDRLNPSWERFVRNLQAFVTFGEKISEINSKSKVAFGAVSFAYKMVMNQVDRDVKIERLVDTIDGLYSFFFDAKPLEKILLYQKTVSRLLVQTADCAFFIAEYCQTKSFASRVIVNTMNSPDDIIAEYTLSFGELKIELIIGTSLQTALTTVRILQKVEKIESSLHVNQLPHLSHSSWDPTRVCLRGSRDDLLDEIFGWIAGSTLLGDKSDAQVYMLVGEAKTGKSSIAHTVAQKFHEQGRLASAVFLTRKINDEKELRTITSTIARELAAYDDTIKERMGRIIERNPAIITASVDRQFLELIVKSTAELTLIGPVVIIIDGLHQCDEHPDSLEDLYKALGSLPLNFRILVTLRPNSSSESVLMANGNCYRREIDFDAKGSKKSSDDLIKKTLSTLAFVKPDIFREHSCTAVRDMFIPKSRNIHLWASIACDTLKFCPPDDGRRFIKFLLTKPVPRGMDDAMAQLYDALLLMSLPHDPLIGLTIGWNDVFACLAIDSRYLTDFILRPTSNHLISQNDAVGGTDLLRKLGCITETLNAKSSTFGLHPSFQDFLTDGKRCVNARFYVDLGASHSKILAEKCLDGMNNNLRHNICRIIDPSLRNSEIPKRDEVMETHISNGLIYASGFWFRHLTDAGDYEMDVVLNKLEVFLSTHLLHWIELQSMLGVSEDIVESLGLLEEWLKRHVPAKDAKLRITGDAISFMQIFSPVISSYALHTYISALPLMPADTVLYQTYYKEDIPERPVLMDSNISYKWACDKILVGHTGSVQSISLSQDGSRIVSASSDMTIRVWDSHSCALIRELKGHKHDVYYASLSPDGLHIASCSADKTMIVWSVGTGVIEHEIPVQHENWARYISYSPDGSKLVTCSSASEIALWDTDLKPAGVLLGHTDSVRRAVFSSSGVNLASASKDNTVRIWDVKRRCQLGKPLLGHKHMVLDVAWSRDSLNLASASADKTVRLWDFTTRQTLAVFEGHTNWIFTVSFSPDSSRLVSGARDSTVRIWDAKQGIQMGPSLRGHDPVSSIESAHFLFDGGEIVSASSDRTLRMWICRLPSYALPPSIQQKKLPSLSDDPPMITYLSRFRRLTGDVVPTVDDEGWICTMEGYKVIWTPYPRSIILDSTPGKLIIKSPTDSEGTIQLVITMKN